MSRHQAAAVPLSLFVMAFVSHINDVTRLMHIRWYSIVLDCNLKWPKPDWVEPSRYKRKKAVWAHAHINVRSRSSLLLMRRESRSIEIMRSGWSWEVCQFDWKLMVYNASPAHVGHAKYNSWTLSSLQRFIKEIKKCALLVLVAGTLDVDFFHYTVTVSISSHWWIKYKCELILAYINDETLEFLDWGLFQTICFTFLH